MDLVSILQIWILCNMVFKYIFKTDDKYIFEMKHGLYILMSSNPYLLADIKTVWFQHEYHKTDIHP